MKPKNSLERVLAVLEVFSEERLEWTPEDLMRELGYSRPTLYRYLKILKDAGLIVGEVEPPRVCYCLNEQALESLKRALAAL